MRLCRKSNCKAKSTHGWVFMAKQAIYCNEHALENMIRLKNLCIYTNCNNIARYGFRSERKELYCHKHQKAKEGLCRISRLCPSCDMVGSINLEGKYYCANHYNNLIETIESDWNESQKEDFNTVNKSYNQEIIENVNHFVSNTENIPQTNVPTQYHSSFQNPIITNYSNNISPPYRANIVMKDTQKLSFKRSNNNITPAPINSAQNLSLNSFNRNIVPAPINYSRNYSSERINKNITPASINSAQNPSLNSFNRNIVPAPINYSQNLPFNSFNRNITPASINYAQNPSFNSFNRNIVPAPINYSRNYSSERINKNITPIQ